MLRTPIDWKGVLFCPEDMHAVGRIYSRTLKRALFRTLSLVRLSVTVTVSSNEPSQRFSVAISSLCT